MAEHPRACRAWLLALTCALTICACGRSKPKRSEAPAPAVEAPVSAAEAPALAVEAPASATRASAATRPKLGAAARLDRIFGVDSPTSLSTSRPSWPPARRAGALSPVVYLGRSHLTAGDRRLLAMGCLHDGRPCDAAQARGPVDRTSLTIDTDDLDPPARGLTAGHGTINALAVLAGRWRDKEVLLLADRRVAWLAVHQVMHTLAAVGAQVRPCAVDAAGAVVELNLDRPIEGQRAWADRPPKPSAKAAPALPADLRTVEVQVGESASWMVLQGATGKPEKIRVNGSAADELSAHVKRVLSAHPGLPGVSVVVDDGAPWQSVVQLVDALRDDCASRPAEVPCKGPVRLFARIELSWTGDWMVAEQSPPPARPAAAAAAAPSRAPAVAANLPGAVGLRLAPMVRGVPPTRIAPTIRLDRPGWLRVPQAGAPARGHPSALPH